MSSSFRPSDEQTLNNTQLTQNRMPTGMRFFHTKRPSPAGMGRERSVHSSPPRRYRSRFRLKKLVALEEQ